MVTPGPQKLLRYEVESLVPRNKFKIVDSSCLTNNYNFPSYYKFVFNVLYYLFLSPFKISYVGGSQNVIFSQHPVQKAICATLHIFLWIFSVPTILGSLKVSIHKDPASIYRIFTTIVWTSNICILSYQSWYIHDSIRNVFVIGKKKLNICRMNCFAALILLIFSVHLIPLYFSVPWDFTYCRWYENLAKNFLYLSRFTRSGLSLNVSSLTEGSTFEIAFVICCVLYSTVKDAIGFLLFIYLLISCVAVHEVACCLKSQQSPCTDSQAIMVQINYYVQATNIIQRVSSISGPHLIVNFISAISFTSMEFVKVLEGSNWPSASTILLFLTMMIAMFVIAAEAHAKLKSYEDHLRQYRIFDESSSVSKCSVPDGHWYPASVYIDSISGSKGLSAGEFFTVSYSLLGQAVTVLITYVIITIQLETGK